MGSLILDPRQLPLVEVGTVPEFYAEGIGPVEIVGGLFRVAFFTVMTLPRTCQIARVPVVSIVRPIEAYVPNQLARLLQAECHTEAMRTAN